MKHPLVNRIGKRQRRGRAMTTREESPRWRLILLLIVLIVAYCYAEPIARWLFG